MRTRTVVLAGAFLLLGRVLVAQERQQPLQELFFTEVVYPQEKGEIQVTVGTLVDRSRAERGAVVPLEVEYGLTDRWQLQAGWEGATEFHASPIRHLQTARVSVGTKYSLMHIARAPVHAALGIDAEFPQSGSFTDGEGAATTEFEPFVALAADVKRITMFGSMAASLERRKSDSATNEGDDRGTIAGGAFVVIGHVVVATEYTSRSDTLPWRINGAPLLSPSVVLHPPGKLEIGLGAPIAMRRGHRSPGIAIQVVREF